MQRFQNFSQQDILIPFKVELWNVGGAMDLQSGKFTATRPGTYFFSFTGWVYFPPVPLKDDFNVFLYLNGNSIARGHVNEMTNSKQVFGELMETFTMQATLNLKAGDQIWLMVAYSSAGLLLCGSNVTHFTSFMLQGNISQSVKLSFESIWCNAGCNTIQKGLKEKNKRHQLLNYNVHFTCWKRI